MRPTIHRMTCLQRREMSGRSREAMSALSAWCCVLGVMAGSAMATEGPPVKIMMPADSPPAERGQAYHGMWEVRVLRAGVIDDFALEGNGWTVASIDRSLEGTHVEAGVYPIAFVATPRLPNAALKLTLRFDRRRVTRRVRIGPLAFARRGKDRPAVNRIPGNVGGAAGAQPESAGEEPQAGVPLHFSGRIVYSRPSDTDNNLPIWFGATDEGVDRVLVEIMEQDDGFDETIWSGYTDVKGFFEADVVWDDCDAFGCDTPDIYMRWECDTDIVNVQDAEDILEPDFSWSTEDVLIFEDFTGSSIDFGTWTPGTTGEMAPLHIHNSITRAHRFLMTKSGVVFSITDVDVLWPDGDNAFHVGPLDEIHISVFREWEEGTHIHEYGHHLLDEVAENVDTDYCQGLNFCDGAGRCSPGTDCEDPGHCMWCPETDHDAWNEGFPNWMADAITRDFQVSYTFEDGSPYEALIPRSLENLDTCCQDGGTYSPWITEGFVGALLRDIEDGVDIYGRTLQDDHDGDGMCDCLELGYDEIFTIALIDDVITVNEFITTFISRYPQYLPGLRSTAFNVHPMYIDNFPADTAPPGVVPYATSDSHPPIVGGTKPCIELRLGPVDDDVSGACGFSYEWSTTPAGVEPDSDEEGNYVEASCCIVSPPRDLGDHWVSLRAKDCAGNWSSEWTTFGPFTVTECNGNGILDVCEIPCYDWCGNPCVDPETCDNGCDISVLATDPDRPVRLTCDPALLVDFCQTRYPGTCGMGKDCNGNLQPDECDIAEGLSADCNEDGVPDECQNMATWIGGDGSWHDPQNWDTGQVPQSGQLVCIDDPDNDITVTYTAGTTDIWSLSCHDNMDFRETSTNHELAIQANSFVRGDLIVGGRSGNRINHSNTLTVEGLFSITGDYWFEGAGALIARGGMSVTGTGTLRTNKDLYLPSGSNATATSFLYMNSGASINIAAGSLYDYQGSFNVVSGSTGEMVIDGTLLRSSGDGDAHVQAPVQNSGLIHNQTGELILYYGGTHSGDVVSDPGTLLSLRGVTEMLPGSSLTADDVELQTGSNSQIRGDVNIAGTLTVDGSTWTFTNEASVTSYGTDLLVNTFGTVHFESPAAPAIDFDSVVTYGTPHFDTGETFVMNSLQLLSRNIYGADPITINDSFTWGGSGSFFSGGAVTCLGPVTIQATSSQRNLSRLFYNTAHATFLGSFTPTGSGRFINTSTGTVDLQGNVGLTGGQSTNDGTITKTAGTGSSTLSGMTNNSLIHAQTGEIYFYFGGQNNGDILGDPGTLLSFNGTFPFNPGSSLTGDDVKFFNSTTTVEGDVDIAGTLTIDGGTCTFTSNANVTSYGQQVDALTGSFYFESPTPGPSVDFGGVQIGGGSYSAGVWFNTGQPVTIGTLHIINGNVNGSDPITITGAFTWGGVGSFLYGGKVTCNADATVQYSSSQRNCYRHFDNNGYLTLLGAFNPSGGYNFTNLPGGTVDLQSDNGRFGLSTTSALYNQGTLKKTGGSGSSSISVDFENTGTVEVLSGAIEMYAGYGQTFIQTAGQTILNGGNLNLTVNAVYQIQGGDLTGNGTVFGEVDNSGGRVVPGLSIGTLTCDDYTHGVGATLKVEIGGLDAGTEHDQFVVTGTANLQGGELNVVPFGGFLPQLGQQFVVLTAGSVQGTFDDITGPGEYSVTYNPTNVTLTVVQPPCSNFVGPDFDQDCDVDGNDVAAFIACASGPTVPHAPGCDDMDLDLDGDADQTDFAVLQRCISGEGIVAEANCAN